MLGSTIPSFKRKRERESILYWAKNVLKNHVSYHISVIIIIGRLQMFTHYVQPKKYSLTRQHCEYKVMRRLRVSGEKVGGGEAQLNVHLGRYFIPTTSSFLANNNAVNSHGGVYVKTKGIALHVSKQYILYSIRSIATLMLSLSRTPALN